MMFSIKVIEGKDHPNELGPPEYDDHGGKTVGLLLHLLKSVFHSGWYVVLNSGFCVLQAIIKLRREFVFAGALIKKCHFWPTLVPRVHILEYFQIRQ